VSAPELSNHPAESSAEADWHKALPLILLVGLCTYANSFTGAFLFDDVPWITESLSIAHPAQYLREMASRPVVALTLALNYRLGGLSVLGYHALNLAIHVGAALALFGVVRRTLLLPRWSGHLHRSAPWLALAVALIWLVHPLQTESVTYIIQRCESLMGFFYLLTLYCVIRSVDTPSGRLAWSLAAVGACTLGMGCKEVMATAPLVVLLYDRTFLAGSFRQLFRQRWGLYAGLAAAWLVLLACRTVAPPPEASAGFGFKDIAPLHYAMTQPGVILHYLRLSLWPYPLCLDYFDWPVTTTLTAFLMPGAVVAVLLAGTVVGLLRGSWLGFLGAWFFLILAPTSSIMPLADRVFEHRMYLSLAAVVLLVVIGGHAGLDWLGRRRLFPERQRALLGTALVLVVVASLAVLTLRRNEVYHSPVTMCADIVRQRPGIARDRAGLAAAYEREGRLDLALEQAREAVRLAPQAQRARISLGAYLWQKGDVKEALAQYERARQQGPASAVLSNDLGIALLYQGAVDRAAQCFQEAVQLEPGRAQYHYRLARTLSRLRRSEEAGAEYLESLRLDPDWPRRVIETARQLALEEGPRPATALEDAVCYAEQANEATGYQSADMADVLGIVYAAAGRFDEAATSARKGLDLAGDVDPENVERMRLRLRLYERHLAFTRENIAAQAARPG
jgi:tetratricopeptide (TPR) repeat protein